MKNTTLFGAVHVNRPRWEMSDDGIEEAAGILNALLEVSEVVMFRDIVKLPLGIEGDSIKQEMAATFADAVQAVYDERFRIRDYERGLNGGHDLIFIDENNYPAMPGRSASGFCIRNSSVGVGGIPSGVRELALRYGRAKGSLLKIAEHQGADRAQQAILSGKIDNLLVGGESAE